MCIYCGRASLLDDQGSRSWSSTGMVDLTLRFNPDLMGRAGDE